MQQQDDFLFEHDNTDSHISRTTQRALQGVRQLPWPARSPDPR